MGVINQRENALRVLTGSADPEWVPFVGDCFHIVVPNMVRERPVRGADGEDWFGCKWVWDADCMGFAPNVRRPPLCADITRWREFVEFPDLDIYDWKAAGEQDLEGFDREGKLLRVIMESGPFERTQIILGFENAFLAMYEEPAEFKALIGAVTDFKIRLLGKICNYYKPDEIMLQDDLGTASGPQISLDMYREFIKPAHKKLGEAMRANDVFYTHHSCGKMDVFIGDLIEVGVRMVNPVQPMNDYDVIAGKYAGSICFEVGPESKANYPGSTEDEIRQEVRQVVDTFGPYKNLMLVCFPSNAECMHNYDIAIDEIRSYGAGFYSK